MNFLVRRYETPDACDVSDAAKMAIDSDYESIKHIEWAVEEAKRLGLPSEVADRLQEIKDLHLDMAAIICKLDALEGWAGQDKAVDEAMSLAAMKHLLDHVTGQCKKGSPAKAKVTGLGGSRA
jgi:hypothetical protein